jgi:hypothetical protein
MNKYKRLSHISGLPVSEILALTEQIRSAEVAPDEIRSSISNQEAVWRHRQGGWDILRGLGLLAAAAALVGLTPSLSEAGRFVALACLAGGALLLFLGYRTRQPFNELLRRARDSRRKLEGASGFLWRFEGLLRHADADGPVQIHESLLRCCEGSRRLSDSRSRDDLVQYFYWLTQVDSHLLLAEHGEHDALLDPHAETGND